MFDDRGAVRHRRGVTAVRGLYFLGLAWEHTRGSALRGWVKDDARHIAGAIEDHAGLRRRESRYGYPPDLAREG